MTQVGYITRDSDITFKVKRSKVNLQGTGGILSRPLAQLVIVRPIIHLVIKLTSNGMRSESELIPIVGY